MLCAADVSSGARKWSLVFVGIGVGAIVAALFQVRCKLCAGGMAWDRAWGAWASGQLSSAAIDPNPMQLQSNSTPCSPAPSTARPVPLPLHHQNTPQTAMPPTPQSYSFNYMGQKLGRRVRVRMFRALLRQVGRRMGCLGGCNCGGGGVG